MRELQQRDPDINVVLKAKEEQEKPDADKQKSQSLETRWLL